jgi:hypothetical protein
MGPANAQRFRWNQNALLKKIGYGNQGEITISWMVKPVTPRSALSPVVYGEVLQFCAFHTAPPPPRHVAHHESATLPAAIGRRLRDRMTGRKIVALHKNQNGR